MSRPNYYQLLELDYNVDDIEEIKKAILSKQVQWSRLLNHPSKKNEALTNLAALKGIEKDMSDPDKRREEAEQARKLDMEEKVTRERELYKELDATIKIAAKKGWIEEAEVQLMTELFSLSINEIQSRISFPIESRPVKSNKAKRKQVSTSKAKAIAENCEKLGIKSAHVSGIASLYDYLQIAPTSSSAVLIQAADERYKRIVSATKSAENNMDTDLQAHSKTIFQREPEREQYDHALSQLRLQKMDNYLKVAGASKVLQLPVMEQLKIKAMSLGDLTADEAQTYIEEFCRNNEIELAKESEKKTVRSIKKCGFCGLINDGGNNACSKCGTSLKVTCPNCNHKADSNNKACGNCGFLLGNIANVPKRLAEAKIIIHKKEFERAKELLEEILDWWPNHPEAKEKLLMIAEQENETEYKLSNIQELIQQKNYYTVRKTFIKERHLVQSSLSLQSMEKESLQHIHLAESYVLQAENIKDESEKIDYYLKAIEVAADCEKATRILAKWPPSPPSSLQVSAESSKISLQWQASSAKGHIVYRVLRKKGEASKHFKDGDILQETTDCSYSDHTAVGGYPYYYSIYALRGSIVSQINLSEGPLIRKAEVENIKVTHTENQVELKWEKPTGAIAIEVWKKENERPNGRQDGQLVKEITQDGVIDKDVNHGESYGYFIVAVYEVAGKKLYSEGLARMHKLTSMPKMLQDITAERKSDGIMLHWNKGESSNDRLDIYYAHSPFSIKTQETIAIEDLPNLGQTVAVEDNQNGAFLQVDMKQTVYLLPVTYDEEVAVIGEMIVSKDHPEVSNVRHTIVENDMLIQWNWPDNIQEVVIICGEDSFPKYSHNTTGTFTVLDKDKYHKLNGYKTTLKKRDYYFTVFTRFKSDGKLTHSNGVTYLVVNSDLVNVTYELKTKGFFSKRGTLHITCDTPILLPDLVLTKKESDIPINRGQGKDIHKIKAQKIEHTEQFDIPIDHFQNGAYAKLFFENEQNAQKIRLQALHGKESMQLW